MNRFRFHANAQETGLTSGELDATSAAEAVKRLEEQGLSVISIELVPVAEVEAAVALASFHEQLDRRLADRSAWLPRIEALLEEFPRGAMRRGLHRQLEELKGIANAQEFLANRQAIELLPLTKPFDEVDDSNSTLRGWLLITTHRKAQRSRWLRAMVYPAVVFAFSILVFLALAWFVLPVYRSLYDEMELHIPAITRWLLWTSELVTTRAVQTMAAVSLTFLVLTGGIAYCRRYALTNRLFGRLVAGRTSNLMSITTFSAILAELVEMKAPMPMALRIAGFACQHRYYQKAAESLSQSAHLETIASIPKLAIKRLPGLVIDAMRSDAEGRPSVPMLRELAHLYSDRARSRTDWISFGAPSFALLILGLFIGWYVIALFAPMIQMITTLSR